MSTNQPTATSYAYDHAYSQTFDLANMGLRDAQVIALDFEQRFEESDAESVCEEWSAYVADIGGFANFPSYVRALYATRLGYVTCATCGEMHWYLTEGECGTYMASLAGFTCGQEGEDDEEEPKVERTVWQLAGLAGCSSPDSVDSAGAAWLVRVARDAEELAEDQGDDLTDGIAERADSNVPIYTHELWSIFVDLGAYQEDVSELIGAGTDMEKMAQVALYMIAERLLSALLEAA
jgi:hypothetical protein